MFNPLSDMSEPKMPVSGSQNEKNDRMSKNFDHFRSLFIADKTGCKMNPCLGTILRNNNRFFKVTGVGHASDDSQAIEITEISNGNKKELTRGELREMLEDGRLVWGTLIR